MVISAQTYEQVAWEDPDGKWELHDGVLRQKPPMTNEHNSMQNVLGMMLGGQLDYRQFELRVDSGKTRRADHSYYIPDLFVVPKALVLAHRGQGSQLEIYDEPLPLVVEVWSPSTGAYDIDDKIPEYERRGDLEVWRIHPYERTLRARRRQSDGSYTETLYTGGTVAPVALPGVVIDLDALFD